MRVSKSFNPEIDKTNKKEFYITINHEKASYRVRVLKIQLKTGEIEILITNIDKEAFKYEEFIDLYYKRWPIETKYDTVKNKLLLETFSGRTPLAILQDFYATMYLSNMIAFAKLITDEKIEEEQKDKQLKYKYQTNEKILIGSLKNELIMALTYKNSKKRVYKLNIIFEEVVRSKSEIRPGRHFGRPDLKKWRKPRCAKKRNAI